MEFEDILTKVGEDGLFQTLYTFLFLVPVAIITPWLTMTTIFLVSTPKHLCSGSDLVANFTRVQIRSLLSNGSFTHDQKCFLNETGPTKCSEWIFDDSNYRETFVTKVSGFGSVFSMEIRRFPEFSDQIPLSST